jgi:hypothetical protein
MGVENLPIAASLLRHPLEMSIIACTKISSTQVGAGLTLGIFEQPAE